MDKLDENLELVYSKEMTIPIDTTDWLNKWAGGGLLGRYPQIEIGTVLDEGDGFVICYEKYVGDNGFGTHFYGYDSTFFLKTDYNLNIVHPPVYDDEWDEEDCDE